MTTLAAAPPPSRLDRDLRVRLVGRRPSDRLWGWLAPLLVALVGGFFRFWQLDRPHQLVFDETYYVKQAYSYLKVGYELRWNGSATPSADQSFTQGTPDVFTGVADFVVHPPVGKWMIAAGMELFGGPLSSWGWRFSAALCGTLSILMLGRIARRLFASTLLGTTAALLMSLDGLHLVESRTGLLDIFVMFWALAGFGCLLIDRDHSRARLAQAVLAAGRPGGVWGPWLGVRPWRLAGAVCLGLCAGTKWSGFIFFAVFATMSVLWDVGARRSAGVPHWLTAGLVKDGGFALVTTVPLMALTYLASWAGWFASRDGWDRQWAAQHPASAWPGVPAALRSLMHYHAQMWQFNVSLTSPHTYQANPWSWIVLGRPTSFFYESKKLGEQGCTVESCSKAINALGNPVIWWGGTVAILVLLLAWLLRRDWRAGAILAGIAAGWLPWFRFQERTIFDFYAVAFVPWVALALTYVLAMLLGPATASRDRRRVGAAAAGTVVVLAAAAFGFFWPIWTAQVVPHSVWAARMWLPSWI